MNLFKFVKGLRFNADVHGFKISFKTCAQEKTGFANKVSKIVLAHTIKKKAEAVYARSDLNQRRKRDDGALGRVSCTLIDYPVGEGAHTQVPLFLIP